MKPSKKWREPTGLSIGTRPASRRAISQAIASPRILSRRASSWINGRVKGSSSSEIVRAKARAASLSLLTIWKEASGAGGSDR